MRQEWSFPFQRLVRVKNQSNNGLAILVIAFGSLEWCPEWNEIYIRWTKIPSSSSSHINFSANIKITNIYKSSTPFLSCKGHSHGSNATLKPLKSSLLADFDLSWCGPCLNRQYFERSCDNSKCRVVHQWASKCGCMYVFHLYYFRQTII